MTSQTYFYYHMCVYFYKTYFNCFPWEHLLVIFLELQVQTCTKHAKQANKLVFLRLFPASFCLETAGLRVSHILSRWKSQSSKNKKEIFRLVGNFILSPKNMWTKIIKRFKILVVWLQIVANLQIGSNTICLSQFSAYVCTKKVLRNGCSVLL